MGLSKHKMYCVIIATLESIFSKFFEQYKGNISKSSCNKNEDEPNVFQLDKSK